jgi:peptide/nickel transport system ATP-binding protein
MADKVMVMYGGMAMEYAPVMTVYEEPRHPYTHALLNCIPRIDKKQARLDPIPGQPPMMLNAPALCPFLPRCPNKVERCAKEMPVPVEIDENHFLRCFNPVSRSVIQNGAL